MLIFAFLPQHVWEVSGAALAAGFLGFGAFYLFHGSGPAAEGMDTGKVRLIAAAQMLAGTAIGVAAFLVNSEPECGACGSDHWGGTAGIALLGIFLSILAGIGALNIRRIRKWQRRQERAVWMEHSSHPGQRRG